LGDALRLCEGEGVAKSAWRHVLSFNHFQLQHHIDILNLCLNSFNNASSDSQGSGRLIQLFRKKTLKKPLKVIKQFPQPHPSAIPYVRIDKTSYVLHASAIKSINTSGGTSSLKLAVTSSSCALHQAYGRAGALCSQSLHNHPTHPSKACHHPSAILTHQHNSHRRKNNAEVPVQPFTSISFRSR